MYLRTIAAPRDPVSIVLTSKIYGLSGVGGWTAGEGANGVDGTFPAGGDGCFSLAEEGGDEPSVAGGEAFEGGATDGV